MTAILPNGLVNNWMVVRDGQMLACGLTREGAERFVASLKEK